MGPILWTRPLMIWVRINKVIDGFNDQYRYIFKERFIYNRSQAEIAKTLGVSQMTVSRAERNIINQFRSELYK